MTPLPFRVERGASRSWARAAVLELAHGAVATPVFMPVGTRGTVRTVPWSVLDALAPPILLANTVHLMQQPGADVLRAMEGLHKWTGWRRGLLTDSGGYQVFSLPDARVDDAAVTFRPHPDRPTLVLTPEASIAMQEVIGADIMMVLDHCVASTSPLALAREAMTRTHAWAQRSLAARTSQQGLFAIVQGACVPALRRESAEALQSLRVPGQSFDGYAIGGLAVGESHNERYDMTELTAQLLPTDRPRYLMGVGTPLDLLEAVHRGVDMFDCILPTAWAQQGMAFTDRGKIDFRRGVYARATAPLDESCQCEACTRHSQSYLHHLVRCREPLGWQLLAQHNVRYYLRLMHEMRTHIMADTFAAYYDAARTRLGALDLDHPAQVVARAGSGRRSQTRGAFAIKHSAAGHASVQHQSGEVMHSVSEPNAEAERLYVAQSQVLARAQADTAPVVVWDVGLGAAHNAMALIRWLDGNPTRRAHLISFERDLDALRLALDHGKLFPHLRRAEPHRLLAQHRVVTAQLTWELSHGEWPATAAGAPSPQLVFFDPFSAAVNAELWRPRVLAELFGRCAEICEVFSYTNSTAHRAAFLAAGFWVADGAPTGPKVATTIALTPAAAQAGHYALLGDAWLGRRTRSTAPVPMDLSPAEAERMDQLIINHPQFAITQAGAFATTPH